MAIHLGILIGIFQFRSSIEAHLNRYISTDLYLPPVESNQPAVPKVRHTPVVLAAPPPVVSPPPLSAKLPPPLKPALDLPAPPELAATRVAPLPAPHPVLAAPAPAPAPPLPPSPVFASALPATRPTAHSPAPKTGSFGSVPVLAAPPSAKLQVATDSFNTVPAGTPRNGSPTGAVVSGGFGAAGVTAPNPHLGGPTVSSSNGFGGVSAAGAPAESAPKPKSTASAFTSAVPADPVRQPEAKHQAAAEPLEILFKPRPDYTEEARRARLEGDVVLEVLFNSSGGLRVLRVVRGLGRGLDQNAIAAAGKIRFRPATEGGRAVDTVAMIRISFQIAY